MYARVGMDAYVITSTDAYEITSMGAYIESTVAAYVIVASYLFAGVVVTRVSPTVGCPRGGGHPT